MNTINTRTTRTGIRFFDSALMREVSLKDGKPIVLVHGLGASLDVWAGVIPQLAPKYRVLAFDIPGFGDSPAPTGRFTLQSVADATAEFIRNANAHQCLIVGHSLGGILALKIAKESPDLVSRIALVSGPLLTVEAVLTHLKDALSHPKIAAVLFAQFAEGALISSPAIAAAIARNRIARTLVLSPYISSPDSIDPDLLAGAVSRVSVRSSINVCRVLSAVKDVGLAQIMRGVRCPAVIVWGDADPLVTAADVSAAERLLHLEGRHMLERCGHWPPLEQTNKLSQIIGAESLR